MLQVWCSEGFCEFLKLYVIPVQLILPRSLFTFGLNINMLQGQRLSIMKAKVKTIYHAIEISWEMYTFCIPFVYKIANIHIVYILYVFCIVYYTQYQLVTIFQGTLKSGFMLAAKAAWLFAFF